MSMYPWFFWNFPVQYFSLLGAIYTIVLLSKGEILSHRLKISSTIFLFFVLYQWIDKYNNFFSHIESLSNWIIFLGIFSLKEEFRAEIISFITKWFSILLGVSLFFYIIHNLGVSLPSASIQRANALNSYTNYYFFLSIDGQMRFQSIFLEPGHMTMGLAPLLFLNRYNYRNKYVIILLLAQLFSFSLAGYIVMAIGYTYVVLFSSQNNRFWKIVLPVLIFSVFLYLVQLIYSDDLFNDLIMARLEWTGTSIAGDDRSGDYLDYVYDRVCNSSSKWTGEEWISEKSEKGVAGFKLYFVMYGIIGTLLCIISYIKAVFISRSNLIWKAGLLLILFLLLYQNAYPLWWCLLIQLVLGLSYLKSTERNRI